MGQPTVGDTAVSIAEYIGNGSETRGSETSQYPEEKKEKFDFQSSGERNGNSPNFLSVIACMRCSRDVMGLNRISIQTGRFLYSL